jgi:hypothetical protein
LTFYEAINFGNLVEEQDSVEKDKKKGVMRLVEEKKSNHGPSSHFLMMILCCAIPIIAIVVLSSMGILGSWGFYLLMLLCPLLHFLLMGKMGSRH